MPGLTFLGDRTSGQDVRTQNVTACVALANIVKSSLGPEGLDKMMVDQVGDVTITNDGATILKKLEVEHPAARVLVELAQHQDEEVGDGTTSVVILAAELLKRGNELVKRKTHATSVISGFRVAMTEACSYIEKSLAVPIESLPKDALLNVARTSMSSKIIGSESDFFSDLVVKAILRIKQLSKRGEVKYPIGHINVLRSTGKSAKESQYIEGYALNCTIASQGMPKKVTKAKIALLDFNLQKTKLPMGVSITVKDPAELLAIHKREADILKERVDLILKSGANVILTTKAIDDLAQKYLVEAGVMGVRRCKKSDLKKIAKATGGKLILSMANLEGEESFDAANLGEADSVAQEPVSDQELIVIKGTKETQGASIILRGANALMLDEMDRSVHDALCALKRVLEMGSIVPGGGAVEVALAMYLESFARTLGSREQLAIAEFAQALLVIPKTLAVNAAQDAIDLAAKLCTLHKAAQDKDDKKQFARYGLDLTEGKPRDNVAAGVLEPTQGKIKCIQFATEAAMSILRIDDLIKLQPRAAPRGGHDDHDGHDH
jgi:T-complex protein 1 subunit alpha